MEEKADILELLEIDYCRLISESNECTGDVMKALGPEGPGLLAITGVPNAQSLTNTLLSFARKLALMDDTQRRHILKDHGLGTDVSLKKADRKVSSFAAQLNFSQSTSVKLEHKNVKSEGENCYKQRTALLPEENIGSKVIEQDDAQTVTSQGLQHCSDFEGLGNSFKQLGFCMVEVGLRLAQICDQAIEGIELEKVILDAHTAKGRLIHYHSLSETTLLMGLANTKGSNKRLSGKELRCTHSKKNSSASSNQDVKGKDHFGIAEKNNSLYPSAKKVPSPVTPDLWQEWHYDYGIFTLLTTPLFLSSFSLPIRSNGILMNQSAQECSSPDGHTYLKILNIVNSKVMFASAPSGSLIVQVGEAAQILSGGKLHATAHCVCRPSERIDVSRETFVVFLQPAWNKSLSPPKWFYEEREATKHSFEDISASPSTEMMERNDLKSNLNSLSLAVTENQPGLENIGLESAQSTETFTENVNDLKMLLNEIQKILPPLMSRWKEGETFVEFSRETTRKYYGADGMQSNR
ncbi:uncharacterized protein LOC131041914 [Cryptomeria japonica]|uniref:uncharacterized protein LOC131041914 n=1 Tax=Cryptomeria japonica TaxID=3369 RepID=UPI0027DA4420|nr:uncharacterized protein LOC131041914 [Cryptomeria japonica]